MKFPDYLKYRFEQQAGDWRHYSDDFKFWCIDDYINWLESHSALDAKLKASYLEIEPDFLVVKDFLNEIQKELEMIKNQFGENRFLKLVDDRIQSVRLDVKRIESKFSNNALIKKYDQ